MIIKMTRNDKIFSKNSVLMSIKSYNIYENLNWPIFNSNLYLTDGFKFYVHIDVDYN